MNELSRLAALRRYDLLDTPKEAAFDHITRVVARVLGVPIALVSLVDADRQWFKASIGLDVSETPRSGAFCAHAIEQSEPFMIPDAAEDPRFATNPLVTGPPHIRSYAGAPLITPDGFRIGTLCAIDRRPRVHSEGDLATLEDLARVVVEILETRLSERQQRVLAKISTMSSDAAYVYDLKTRETIWESDRSSAVFGFDLRSPPAGVLDLVHPDDRAAVAALSQPPAGTTLAEPLVYRIRSGDSYRWLLSRRSVLDFDEHGKVRSIVGVVSDVTELKRAEERVRTSEHEVAHRVRVLEGILDAAAEAILFVDAGGQVRLTNRFARELLGGITTGVVPPPPDHVRRVGIYSEDGARLLAPDELPMARALRGERVDSMPLMIRNERFPAGVRLLASTRTVRGPEGELGGAVLSLVDVTGVLRAREQLLRANENLRHVTDALPIGLFVHHGEVLYANPALGRLLQREPSSITGRPYTDLIDPEEHAAVAERISRLRRGESDAPQDLRLTSSTGTVVVEVSRIELDYDGKPAVLVMCRDTTAERAAAAQIRDSLREKEALLREIHHRVKNNLAVIASLLYLQAEAVKDEHARAALRESRARVHAIALAHEHLYRTEDLGRVELGSYIAALIAHVVSSLGAEARGIDIAVDHPYEIFVPLDAAHPCGLILNELVTNALKHAFPGARTGTVRVEVRSSPRDVTIAVRDDGVGMPAPLERGSSIGMQLVRELAEQLQATLTIQAATPGTLTTLTFPRPLS